MWGYDPVAKTYVNTWVDTNDLPVRTDLHPLVKIIFSERKEQDEAVAR